MPSGYQLLGGGSISHGGSNASWRHLVSRTRVLYLFVALVSFLGVVYVAQQHGDAMMDVWKGSSSSDAGVIGEDWTATEDWNAAADPELLQIEDASRDYFLPQAYEPHFPSGLLPDVFLAHPKLYRRLHGFLSRPIYSHAEAVALDINERQCPREVSDRLSVEEQRNDNGGFWRDTVDARVIAEKRSEMVRYLERVLVENSGFLDGSHRDYEHRTGRKVGGAGLTAAEEPGYELAERSTSAPRRGIVTTAGNQDTTLRLITLLRILRHRHGCTLPVEVWHFPGELEDGAQRREIESLDGQIRQIEGVSKHDGVWKNFQIKGLAITSSAFQEVLYLDSVSASNPTSWGSGPLMNRAGQDNVPLRDPATLFDSPRYLREGSGRAAFWPDLSKDHVDNAIWRLMGVPCDLDHWTFESGQIVVDKAGNDGLNAAALHLAAYMQGDMDFWFKMCGGDKDTFRWGFVALGLPFTSPLKWATPLGDLNQMDNQRFCGHTILQSDLDVDEATGEVPPLFMHSNLLKHAANVHPGITFTHLKRMTVHDYSEPTLNWAHQWVYFGAFRGMCTDLELWDEGRGLTDVQREMQHVETVELSSIPGQPFDGFEDYFFAEGGRAGGWRRRRRGM